MTRSAYSLLNTHYTLLTTHYSLLTTHYSLLTTHYSLLTTHYSLLTTQCSTRNSLLTTHYLLRTTDYSIPTTHYSLLITHYSLLTTHYSLLTTHYSLLTTHYSLLTTHYSLLTTHLLTTHYTVGFLDKVCLLTPGLLGYFEKSDAGKLMAGRIQRGEFAGPMLRLLWQSLHRFVDENGRRFDFAQDMPDILEEARTTRWAELTAEATNKPLLLNFEAGGDDGCQEELRLFLEVCSRRLATRPTGSSGEIFTNTSSITTEELWSKMEKKPLKAKEQFKKVSAPSLPFAPPSPYQSHPTPLHPAFQASDAIGSALEGWVCVG